MRLHYGESYDFIRLIKVIADDNDDGFISNGGGDGDWDKVNKLDLRGLFFFIQLRKFCSTIIFAEKKLPQQNVSRSKKSVVKIIQLSQLTIIPLRQL